MNRYPRTIANGRGEEITFLDYVVDSSLDRLLVENALSPGAGPPMHVHYLQAESLTVLAGRMGYQTQGGVPRTAAVGDEVTFDAGVGHRFWNAGDVELRCRGWVSPSSSSWPPCTSPLGRTVGAPIPRMPRFSVAWLDSRRNRSQ